jgi:DNA-binding Lrp family transcriptional regulator
LVIGVAEQEDIRRSFEEKFVEKLEAGGIKAVESSSVMSKDQKIDKETILAVVKKTEVDGVLLTYLLAVEEKEVANPGATYSRADDYHGGTIPDLSSAYDYRSGPQYYTTRVKVRLETNLYDAKTEQKVWSARSRTLNPKSDTALMDSVIDSLVKDLKKNKLLP